VKDFAGAKTVLSGGVGVATGVEAVLGGVVAGEAAGDLLLGIQGVTPRSLIMRPRVRVSPTRMVMRPPQLSHNLLFAAVFCLFLPWHAEPSGETLPALNAPRS